MSIPELCERIQDAWLSRIISGSTWGYPIVGALHVLVIALAGGAILTPHLRILGLIRGRQVSDLIADVRWVQRAGLTLIAITGVLLFASGAVGYYKSASFRMKMGLLVFIVLNTIAASRQRGRRLHAAIALVLWAAVIFAARGIAYF